MDAVYDVIVVGARVAGSSTAMLLARAGLKVLLVDRSQFPSDTLSTHYLWPRGMSYLRRIGVYDQVCAVTPTFTRLHATMEGVDLIGSVPREDLRARFSELHGDVGTHEVTDEYCSVRRTILDALLLREAASAGADVREGFAVDRLIHEGDRVVGIEGRDVHGARVRNRATVVVGADGRRSFVAKAVKAQIIDAHPKCSFAYYSYFSDCRIATARLFRTGRLGVAAVPTNDGAVMVLLYGPGEWFGDFRKDAQANFGKGLRMVSVEFAERLEASRREEKFRGTNDMAGFWRKSAGKGWLLAGDAACFKDQASASGMTHALRDGALAADAILAGVSGQTTIDASLAEYDRRRVRDGMSFYRFASEQGKMLPISAEDEALYRAIAGRQTFVDRFFSMAGDTFPSGDLLSATERAELEAVQRPESERVVSKRRSNAKSRNPF